MPSSLVAPLLASALAFGPADPVPPRTATCFDAAAGTIAVGRETSRGWVVETSTADGPWQRVIGPLKGRLCPVLAAAPDGTAVVAAGSEPARVATRPPGGTFGTATRLPGGRTSRLAAAAAPGGHVAVLWAPREPKTRKLALRALVAAPGRPTAQAVITRSGSVDQPALVIGPDGVATAGWTALHPLRKRTSEFRGGRWSTPVNVATSNEFSETSGVSLAVAPNGRRLMAWEADDGVGVQVDGEPATVVAPKPDFTSAIVGALADDGSAILTFIADDGPMLGVDRAPGGAWSPPHALPLGDAPRHVVHGRPPRPADRPRARWAGHGHLAARERAHRRRHRAGRRRVGGDRLAPLLARPVRVDPALHRWPDRLAGAGRLRPARRPAGRAARCLAAHGHDRSGVHRAGGGPDRAAEARTDHRPAPGSDVKINVAVADRAGNQTRRTVAVRVKRR